jgi:hypothetical protein
VSGERRTVHGLRWHIREALSGSSADARDVGNCSRSHLERLAWAVAGPAWVDLGGRAHRVALPHLGWAMPRRRVQRLIALIPRAERLMHSEMRAKEVGQ